ncbi:lactate utilization protein C [Natrarchaeobius oligotrophus]|uniref:Lactate utilization protein C n=2 Tax=Natrarchaeobius TaxID=2501796 RepID=A0A3N6PP74_NATCH|nr:lactate utilization protein C [Natrarchaeobius chitinivorans]
MTGTLERFEDAVRGATASTHRATPETIGSVLSELLVEPAVGAPPPFDDVSLADLPVSVATEPTRQQLLEASTGVTGAILGIASYGSVVLRSTADVDELVSLFPDRHVVLVRDRDVVDDMAAAFDDLVPLIADERADAIVATGPSATADMGALVYGVHGPTEVHVVVVRTDSHAADGTGGTG